MLSIEIIVKISFRISLSGKACHMCKFVKETFNNPEFVSNESYEQAYFHLLNTPQFLLSWKSKYLFG